MKKVVCKTVNISRQRLADCCLGMPYKERLVKSNAVDLTKNHVITECGNGYIKIKAINKSRTVK